MKDAVRRVIQSMVDEPEFKSIIRDVLTLSDQKENIRLSRLKVDKEARIYLLDYNNAEVDIEGYQAKVLYLFYLLSPVSVSNADLIKYKDVLIQIYSIIYHKDISMGRAIETIDGLLNVNKGLKGRGISDATSKIRKALKDVIPDRETFYYYIIDGERRAGRGIRLPEHYIYIDNSALQRIRKSAFASFMKNNKNQ